MIGPSQLPGVGETWSAPSVARVNVNRTWPSSNPDKMVLVFGGGYDVSQDTISYVADDEGNRIFMVDALTGSLIWRAGPTSDSGAQLQLAKMTNSIPADVRVIDLTGDGFADRMYAADLGGRVWRFDIKNGETPANLALGGVFASLGTGDLATKTGAAADAANRRFFYAPDVALMKSGTTNWINVAIGSGHRELPITDQTAVNRFYSLRDYNIFSQVTNSQYKATCGSTETSPCHQIITDDDSRLVDVTTDLNPTIPSGGVGWRMNLQDLGEKALAESRTFQNKIYFTTYSPQQRSFNPEFCVATVGLNRLYVVDAATGDPVTNFDVSTPGATTASDRSKELAQGSIAPEAIFVFPTPDADPNNPNPPAVPPICLVGLESCGTGLLNPPVRTYWQQRGTN
jgi:type IV pilus assembly protein PilY1